MDIIAILIFAISVAFAVGLLIKRHRKNSMFTQSMREDFRHAAERRAKERSSAKS
ncbi:hypothetical protein [Methylotenera sp.]|uniref:hypothetical protein n=1 Tax=Methylotenera sp. TaxID=2051956 RepID=UPI0025F1E58E|nr:hypothetical protein [Methylotenera sp.]